MVRDTPIGVQTSGERRRELEGESHFRGDGVCCRVGGLLRPSGIALRVMLLLTCGIALACSSKSVKWSVEALRQGDEVLVLLHDNDFPTGPAHVSLNGRRMDVVTRGGTRPTFKLGPSAFGPDWSHTEPKYRATLNAADATMPYAAIRVDGTSIMAELENFAAPRQAYLVGSNTIVPGEEVSLRHEPPSGLAPGGYHLNVYFRDDESRNMRLWATSSEAPRFTADVTRLACDPDGTMRFHVPKDARPAEGELVVNGFVSVKVLRCESASGCGGDALINSPIKIRVASFSP
jgi:hypothetical protein